MESKISSPISLLEQGLDYFRQGRRVDGITLWEIAREGLPPEKMHLAAMIDAFFESYDHYRQAEQAFHQACRYFVEAENKQQTLLLTIEKLLMASQETTLSTSSQPFTPAQASNDFQGSRTLNSTQSLAADHNGNQSPQPLQSSFRVAENHNTLPALSITFFGRFEIKRQGQPLDLCQNRNGQAILRYLIAQPDYTASADTLMGVFWAEDSPEAARRKLQIAVSIVRHSLNSGYSCDRGGGYILCKNQFYQINSIVTIHTDVDEFLSLWKAGSQASASQASILYESACQLYTGPFLVEDMYADWSFPQREQLHQIYVAMCRALANYYTETSRYEDARKWTSAILREDHCDEEAHRQLIRIYSAEGRRSEALRQFQRCERILAEELGVSPMPETMQLLQTFLTGKSLPNEESENRAKIERK